MFIREEEFKDDRQQDDRQDLCGALRQGVEHGLSV